MCFLTRIQKTESISHENLDIVASISIHSSIHIWQHTYLSSQGGCANMSLAIGYTSFTRSINADIHYYTVYPTEVKLSRCGNSRFAIKEQWRFLAAGAPLDLPVLNFTDASTSQSTA